MQWPKKKIEINYAKTNEFFGHIEKERRIEKEYFENILDPKSATFTYS